MNSPSLKFRVLNPIATFKKIQSSIVY